MENRLLKSIKTGLADICYIWRKEYVAVFRDMGAMLFFFALPFAYPLLYAFIYNPEVVNDVPLAVVDNSRTQLSREMCRRIDASPNTKVLSYCANLDEAKELMYQRDCFGILEIPADFDKKLARGEQSPVIFYSDMSLLLNWLPLLLLIGVGTGGYLAWPYLEGQLSALGAGAGQEIQVVTGYMVHLGSRDLGVVQDRAAVENFISSWLAQKNAQSDIVYRIAQEITYEEVRVDAAYCATPEEVESAFVKHATLDLA